MAPAAPNAPQQPQGGLAPESQGGLAKFFDDVNRGVEVVMSHPLYARAWSGMVSGMAGDPMAGPMALAQMRQSEMDQRYQRTQMQRAEEQYTTEQENDLLRRRNVERLQSALGSGDRRSIMDAYSLLDPEGAVKYALTTESRGRPVQVLRDGKPAFAYPDDAVVNGMQPVPRSPLVQIGGEGLNPYQTAQTRKGYIDAHRDESKPYVETAGRLRELDGILSGLDGEPTPFQSEAAATAFAKGLKPAEAVMRDDIARILGQGWENQLKGFLNLPQKASRAQIEQMRQALAQIVAVAEMRQRGIDQKYQALGSDYQVEIPTYFAGSQSQQPRPTRATPTADATQARDAAYFESLEPGEVVGSPDGSRWRKMADGSFEEVK